MLNPKLRRFTVWLTFIAWTQKDHPSVISFRHSVNKQHGHLMTKMQMHWWVLKVCAQCNQTQHKLHSPLSHLHSWWHSCGASEIFSQEEAEVEKWNKTKQRPISGGRRGLHNGAWTKALTNNTHRSKMFFGPKLLFAVRGNRSPN